MIRSWRWTGSADLYCPDPAHDTEHFATGRETGKKGILVAVAGSGPVNRTGLQGNGRPDFLRHHCHHDCRPVRRGRRPSWFRCGRWSAARPFGAAEMRPSSELFESVWAIENGFIYLFIAAAPRRRLISAPLTGAATPMRRRLPCAVRPLYDLLLTKPADRSLFEPELAYRPAALRAVLPPGQYQRPDDSQAGILRSMGHVYRRIYHRVLAG
jgi:hypothetical protein